MQERGCVNGQPQQHSSFDAPRPIGKPAGWQHGCGGPEQKPLEKNLQAVVFALNYGNILMTRIATFLCALIAFAGATAFSAETNFTPLALEGQTFIHDPSTINKDGQKYFIYGTGPGIRSQSSPDLIHWQTEPVVFPTPPAWATHAVPEFRYAIWAPDVIRMNGKFLLYYAISSWGKQVSAIGLATNVTLDASATNFCSDRLRAGHYLNQWLRLQHD